MAGPDIFLSYNREDADTAKLFADAFTREGLEVWWDATLRSGEAYDTVTEAALRGAKAVVVLWSPRSVDSRWVRAEASIADEKGTMAPVMIEACDLPVMFRLTQSPNFSHWRGEAGDPAWLAFLGDVRRMTGKGDTEVPATPLAAPATAGSGAPANVAVLPITLRGSDEDMDFLAEDLTGDITRELAQHDWFKVVSANTMAEWRGKAFDNRKLGHELDARYLVDGKLQRSGDTVRLTVQLNECESGNAVWAHRFAGKVEDFLANPEHLAAEVAVVLGQEIFVTEINRAMAGPGPHSGWDHLLRARAYNSRNGTVASRMGEEEARLAVAAAPDLGMAHAMLAIATMSNNTARGAKRNDELRRQILAHGARALQLDGANPTVLYFVSTANAGLGDGETALRLARRAAALRPGFAQAQDALGCAYLMLGRSADAIAPFTELGRSINRDVALHWSIALLGWCYLLEGMLEEAEDALDRSLEHNPDDDIALRFKAVVAARRGKEASALAAVRRLREVEPDMPLDRHVRFMRQNPHFSEKMAEHIEEFRRLWDVTESEAKVSQA